MTAGYRVEKHMVDGRVIELAVRGTAAIAMEMAQKECNRINEQYEYMFGARELVPATRYDLGGVIDETDPGEDRRVECVRVVHYVDETRIPFKIVWAMDPMPEDVIATIFLAGPTPRDHTQLSWRYEAMGHLAEMGFNGHVFMPEHRNPLTPADWERGSMWDEQVAWEETSLARADVIAFWVPRNMNGMPGLTTNVEYGQHMSSGRVVYGAPPEAEAVRFLEDKARKNDIEIAHTLRKLLSEALYAVRNMAWRVGGEACVPMNVWNTKSFQDWYQAQTQAGNKLHGGEVVWSFRVGPKRRTVFFWAFHAKVWIEAEKRHKINEVVLSRPDVSSVVLIGRRAGPATRIVLIKEFRSTASTSDGYVRENAGGSSWKAHVEPEVQAAEEVQEAIGLDVRASEVRVLGARQVAPTLSAHRAHGFYVNLTDEEIDALAEDKSAHGVEEDTERTYIEVLRLGDIMPGGLDAGRVGWGDLGMILAAYHAEGEMT